MTTRQIQDSLDLLGYGPISNDGALGPATQEAVKKFQRQEGLADDGIPGPLTEAKLQEAVAAGRGYKPQKTTSKPPGKTGTFWDDIEFFTREEFRCQCGGKYCNGFPAEPVEETVRMADEIRRRAGVPLKVNSGVRCKQHNADVGGVWNSLHLSGQAVDLAPIGGNVSVAQLQEIAAQVQAERMPNRGGLGRYDWGVHIDNGKYSRWNG